MNKKNTQLLSKKELEILIDYLKENNDYFSRGILLIICTGIRVGEICALKNSDFDLNEREFIIDKTLQRIQCIDKNVKKTKIVI